MSKVSPQGFGRSFSFRLLPGSVRSSFHRTSLCAGLLLAGLSPLAATPQNGAEASRVDSSGIHAAASESDSTPEPAGHRPAGGVVYRIPVADAIGPVTARFVVSGIERAERDSARAAVIELDTPGGLDTAMRQIVKGILAASVPVIVYVAPAGARAASAGVFIALAAPINAMAPGTSIGAAHPVGLGGGPAGADTVMSEKVTNDAVAYARSLAERHGRNVRWAEEAVRRSVSLSAEEAVRDSVVDLMAETLAELLEKVDGREVRTFAGLSIVRTRGVEIRSLRMTWRENILAILTNPSIAYLLFLAGMLGIALELYNPGTILPGVVGGISLILAFYAFQSLPVSIAGILLILLGLVLFLLEIKVPSYGVLSIGGVVSLILGSLFLYQSGSAAKVSLSVLIPAALTFAVFFLFVAWMAARAQRSRKLTGQEGMVGEIGEAWSDLSPEGKIFVHGEYWNARSVMPVPRGTRVRVRSMQGLMLEVEPLEPRAETSAGR